MSNVIYCNLCKICRSVQYVQHQPLGQCLKTNISISCWCCTIVASYNAFGSRLKSIILSLQADARLIGTYSSDDITQQYDTFKTNSNYTHDQKQYNWWQTTDENPSATERLSIRPAENEMAEMTVGEPVLVYNYVSPKQHATVLVPYSVK